MQRMAATMRALMFVICVAGGGMLAPMQARAQSPDTDNTILFIPTILNNAAAQTWKAPDSPQTEWVYHKTVDGAHPDGNEQQMIWLMNRARRNPSQEGVWLATVDDPDVVMARTAFQVDTDLLQSEFATYAPAPPAAFDVRLYNAARSHSEDLRFRDAQDHNSQFKYVEEEGFVWQALHGNVYAYAESALYAHVGWNIDWGGNEGGMQPGRGHRTAVMSLDEAYTNVGIAVLPDNDPETNVGPYIVTGNYASAGGGTDHHNRFLVGTVWIDANENGQYDPGEGMDGVTVMPNHGDYYAITGHSGGYAVPITQAGDYAVTFSGGELATRITHTISVQSTSVLLDLMYEP